MGDMGDTFRAFGEYKAGEKAKIEPSRFEYAVDKLMEAVPLSAIAALRVGLRSAPYSSPSESAKVQGPQADTHNEEER